MNSTLTVLILAKNEISNVSDEFFDGEPFRSLVQLDLSGNMVRYELSRCASLFESVCINK